MQLKNKEHNSKLTIFYSGVLFQALFQKNLDGEDF